MRRLVLLLSLLLLPVSAWAQIPAGSVTILQGGNQAKVNAFGQLSVTGSLLVPGLTPGSAFALQPGAMVLGVVQNQPAYSLGGVQPLSLTPFGALRVDGSGITQPVSLSTFGVFYTTQPTWTTGQSVVPQATARGALIVSTGVDAFNATQTGTWTVQPGNTANTTPWLMTIQQGGNAAAVNASNQLSVICSSGCSGGPADESAFTFGTTAIFSGGVYQTTPTSNALTTGQAGQFQVTAHRALFTNLRTATGEELGTAAQPLVVTTPPPLVLGRVASAPPIYQAGTNQPIALTSTGGLRVDGTYGLFPNQQSNVTANFNTTTGSTQNLTLWGVALPSASGAVVAGTSTNPLRTDPTGTTTQPISAASLPLPTGAATAAKQPALGTAGTASADVITIQGIASMTKLLVTPDSVALPANQSVNVAQINAVTPLMGNGVTGTGSLRVTLASDTTSNTNAFLVTGTGGTFPATQSGTWTVQPGNTANTTPWLMTIQQGGNAAAVDASNRLSVICSSGCSGGPADESTFTFGTTAMFSGGVYQTTPTNNPLTTGQAGQFQVTAQRALFVNLRDSNGVELGASNPLAVLDLSAVKPGGPAALQRGSLSLGAVSNTPPLYGPGSAQPVSLTTVGALRVDGASGLFPNQQTSVSADFHLGVPVQPVTLWGLALPTMTGAVIGGTETNPIRVDPTGTTTQRIYGTVSLDAQIAVVPGRPPPAQKGVMVLASVAPTSRVYEPNTSQPLSLTSLGAVRTDSSATLQPALTEGVASTGPRPFLFCDKSVAINTASSGQNQLVALLAGRSIYVCGLHWISTSALSVNVTYGTGTNCGTGNTILEGAQAVAANGGLVIPVSPVPKWIVPAGQALCINLSAATQVSGSVTYGQF